MHRHQSTRPTEERIKLKISAVSTLYKSPECIPELVTRLVKECEKFAGDHYEIILVDDCCPKNSAAVAIALTPEFPHVRVIKLSRNFGQHRALMTGVGLATGDHVFILDGDLEESPEWLSLFSRELEAASCDVVFGFQERRRGRPLARIPGEIAWMLLKHLSGLKIKRNLITARLMSRRYVDALLGHRERVTLLAGLWEITGFSQVAFPVTKLSTSTSSYSRNRRTHLYLEGLFSFSTRPLDLIFFAGLIIFFVGILLASLVVWSWLVLGTLEGWASVFSSIWLLSGALMASIGVLGRYIGDIFTEVKQRPYTIVEEDSWHSGD